MIYNRIRYKIWYSIWHSFWNSIDHLFKSNILVGDAVIKLVEGSLGETNENLFDDMIFEMMSDKLGEYKCPQN